MTLTDNLKKRLLTILVGAPLIIGLLYVGGWVFNVFLGVAFFVALYEWGLMAQKAKKPTLLACAGLIYISVGFLSLYMLRLNEFTVILLCLASVWASDSLAYIFGKSFGHFKMSPTISPNKTWEGYAGALLGSFIPFFVAVPEIRAIPFLLGISILIGVVGQSGDLMVSALKRHVKVKDTGSLFPGHGGILDRIDALLLVAPVFLSIVLFVSGWA